MTDSETSASTEPQPMPQHDVEKFQSWQRLMGNVVALNVAAEDNDAPHLVNCTANTAWAMQGAADLPDPAAWEAALVRSRGDADRPQEHQ